jgi:outer membrane protein insertion porin family
MLRPSTLLRILFTLCCALALALPARAAPLVQTIQFSGRMNVKEAACLEKLSLKPGEAFSAEKLEADRKTLLAMGFFRSVGASQATTGNDVQVTFKIVEWPQVTHIRVLGNTVVETTPIREVISTQIGQVLCGPQLQDDIRAVERLYRERGYVARISPRILDEATQSGILRFEILELKIVDLRVEGGTDKLQQRAREAIRQEPPQLYQPEEVTLDQRRLLRIRGIKHAIPKVSIVSPGEVRIVWQLNPPADTPEGTLPNGG